jgi:hypothetical protein
MTDSASDSDSATPRLFPPLKFGKIPRWPGDDRDDSSYVYGASSLISQPNSDRDPRSYRYDKEPDSQESSLGEDDEGWVRYGFVKSQTELLQAWRPGVRR